MHPDQAVVDADVVAELVRAQYPQWADLPLTAVASGGTVNAIYRLGDELSVRLPLTESGARLLAREAEWLPRIGPVVPFRVPTVAAIGRPGAGYPFGWAVHRWLDGVPFVEGEVGDGAQMAGDLAAFVHALRRADLGADGPAAHRSTSLAATDVEVRHASAELAATDERVDVAGLLSVWSHCVSVSAEPAASGWLHSDLMPSNLLGVDGRLSAVIDFGTFGRGDPAVDLVPAWNLLPAAGRRTFREALAVADDEWERGRGWALSMAAIQLPYYRSSNPVISANARYVCDQVLLD